MTRALKADVLAGAYWLVRPADDAEVAIVACGAVVPDAIDAQRQLVEDIPGAGLMIVTSPDRLEADWRASIALGRASHIERLLRDVPAEAGLVTIVDAHPATLSWMGAVGRHRMIPLGVDRFGQSGDIPDLYHTYGIDADAILTAAARLIAPQI
jgi:pyruvate dehydrogenase E1 component